MDVLVPAKVPAKQRAPSANDPMVPATDGELLELFVADRDENAFACLLRRHGPMVLGVCGRTLPNRADVEDAFQATFLVFVHKAASIRPRGMVGNWLYGVARNTALKARAMGAKRLAKEHQAASRKSQAAEPTWDDVQTVLDVELSALPDKYRAAIVLCDVEGNSLKDAARHLRCPLGTVATRLTRGRSLLAKRLAKRGIVPSVATLTALVSGNAASAVVPARLIDATLQVAALAKTGVKTTLVATKSSAASSLALAVIKSLLLARLKATLAVALVFASLTFGGAALARQALIGGWPFATKQKRSDAMRLQGEWVLVKLQAAGKEIPAEAFKDYAEWKMGGDRFSVGSTAKWNGTYRIDPARNPKEIDLISIAPNPPPQFPELYGAGIYKLEKRTLTICLSGSSVVNPERPHEFASVSGSQPTSVFVLQQKHVDGRCGGR
jgi:RNA polymerase sigma factor (sigma-70 family)